MLQLFIDNIFLRFCMFFFYSYVDDENYTKGINKNFFPLNYQNIHKSWTSKSQSSSGSQQQAANTTLLCFQ